MQPRLCFPPAPQRQDSPRLDAGGSFEANPACYSDPPLRLPTGRDFLRGYSLRTNSGIGPGVGPLSISSASSVRGCCLQRKCPDFSCLGVRSHKAQHESFFGYLGESRAICSESLRSRILVVRDQGAGAERFPPPELARNARRFKTPWADGHLVHSRRSAGRRGSPRRRVRIRQSARTSFRRIAVQ